MKEYDKNKGEDKNTLDPRACPECLKFPCIYPGGGSGSDEDGSKDKSATVEAEGQTESSIATHNSSAIQMMNFNPFLGPLLDSDDPRPAESKRLKERSELYLAIGFYRDLDQPENSQMRYYLFEDRHKATDEIKTYSSLLELQNAVQVDTDRDNIFRNNPKVFVMGHGGDDRYGVGGDHPRREKYRHLLQHRDIPTDPSEQIHDDNFDKIINDLREVINSKPGKLSVTLEVCNSDNRYLGKILWGHDKTFLERLSEPHKDITFSGTGPWDSSHSNTAIMTGNRSPGGVNTPIMSMGGNIWKSGNTVAFYKEFAINGDVSDFQVVVKKPKFASTKSAKELKTNTVNYGSAILENTQISLHDKKRILQSISDNRNILKIDDLKIIPDFPSEEYGTEYTTDLAIRESSILAEERDSYVQLVEGILAKVDEADHRGILKIALGLKDYADNGSVINGSVFEGHDILLEDILANKKLLALVMVACGKVLIASPSNDSLIDLLRLKGTSVNSADEYGMTAMHYAVQNFYNYRDKPINLVKKLLDCGANVEFADHNDVTPYTLAMKHASKEMVLGREKLRELVEQEKILVATSPHVMRSLLSANLGFFRKLEDEYLIKHRHDDPKLQQEFDNRFGLILKI